MGMNGDGKRAGVTPGLCGVLVTFRRPKELSVMLERLAEQSRPLDLLVVVDNSPGEETRRIVGRRGEQGHRIRYVPAPDNLGFAGGIAMGMQEAMEAARDGDWIVVLDDDDPPPSPTTLADLLQFAEEARSRDPRTAAVGLTGARFDFGRGRLLRLHDHELHGAVGVDYIGGGQFPLYLAGVLREVGPFLGTLFFAYEDLEYGLRLRKAGYRLYAHGDLWRERRATLGRLGLEVRPSVGLGPAGWRRYYGLRNLVYVLRRAGRPLTAARVTLVAGLAKPLVNLAWDPGGALRHLRLNARACRDAWTGRMGRTLVPEVNPAKPDRAGRAG